MPTLLPIGGLVIVALAVVVVVALMIARSTVAKGHASELPRRLGVFLASFTVFAALAFVFVLRDASRDSGFGPGDGDPPAGGPRTGVEWCVEVEPDDNLHLLLRAKAQIEAVIPLVRADEEARHRQYAKPPGTPFVSDLPTTVESGCPVGPTAHLSGDYGIGRRVSSPGRFSLLIYVLPERPVDRVLGREGYRLTGEEDQCGGDTCVPTASGLYLMEEEVADSALIKYWLYEAVGLGCYRPADALLPFQTPPPGTLNPSQHCDESYYP